MNSTLETLVTALPFFIATALLLATVRVLVTHIASHVPDVESADAAEQQRIEAIYALQAIKRERTARLVLRAGRLLSSPEGFPPVHLPLVNTRHIHG